MQTSGEYDAIALQTYELAFRETVNRVCGTEEDLRACGAGPSRQGRDGRSFAVVFDLDETVLDNSVFQARLALARADYSDEGWNSWVERQIAELRLVPGAREFIKRLEQLGIAPVFISNRPESLRASTVKALVDLGVVTADPGDRLLLKDDALADDEASAKDARRAAVAQRYEVVIAVGDNLGDFADEFNEAATFVRRKQLVADSASRWGTDWFVLPNASYGDWLDYFRELPLDRYLLTGRSSAEDGQAR
jgi:acid phosphatase